MNRAIFRFEKVKSKDGLARLDYYHKHREKHPHLKLPSSANINQSIDTGYNDITHLVSRWEKCTKNITPRSNAVYALDVLLTFSPGCENEIPLQKWIESNKQWLANTFGGLQNVIGLFLHLDQTTPHLHAIIVPLHEGSLNARYYVGDKILLSKLQDSYADAMKEFGLKRGETTALNDGQEKRHHATCDEWYKQKGTEGEKK